MFKTRKTLLIKLLGLSLMVLLVVVLFSGQFISTANAVNYDGENPWDWPICANNATTQMSVPFTGYRLDYRQSIDCDASWDRTVNTDTVQQHAAATIWFTAYPSAYGLTTDTSYAQPGLSAISPMHTPRSAWIRFCGRASRTTVIGQYVDQPYCGN